jgi:hypothetical protein
MKPEPELMGELRRKAWKTTVRDTAPILFAAIEAFKLNPCDGTLRDLNAAWARAHRAVRE